MSEVDKSLERVIATARAIRDAPNSTPPQSERITIPDTSSWSVRIPAAIKKAEEYLGGVDYRAEGTYDDTSINIFQVSATEVALAKALWEMFIDECAHDIGEGGLGMNIEDHQVAFPALIAFTEKIESMVQ